MSKKLLPHYTISKDSTSKSSKATDFSILLSHRKADQTAKSTDGEPAVSDRDKNSAPQKEAISERGDSPAASASANEAEVIISETSIGTRPQGHNKRTRRIYTLDKNPKVTGGPRLKPSTSPTSVRYLPIDLDESCRLIKLEQGRTAGRDSSARRQQYQYVDYEAAWHRQSGIERMESDLVHGTAPGGFPDKEASPDLSEADNALQAPMLGYPHSTIESKEFKLSDGEQSRNEYKRYGEDIDTFATRPFKRLNRASEMFGMSGEASVDFKQVDQRIFELQNEIKALEAVKRQQIPTEWRVIYRVFKWETATNNSHQTCQTSYYLDQPRWYGGIVGHEPLGGTEPILDIRSYLDRHQELAFVVFRDYGRKGLDGSHHSTIGVTRHRTIDEGYPIPDEESTTFVYHAMQDAMQSFLHLLPENYAVPFPAEKDWPREIKAPYLAIYHCRERFSNMVQLLPEHVRGPWNMFANYVQSGFGGEYLQVDCQLNEGVISPSFVKYLIKPGDILFCTQGLPVDAVQAISSPQRYESRVANADALKYPERENEDHAQLLFSATKRTPQNHWSWLIDVVYWSFNRHFRKVRKQIFLCTESDLNDVIAITSLSFYPIRYLGEAQHQKFIERGRYFWKCRSRRYVEYSKSLGMHTWTSTKARYMIDPVTYEGMHGREPTEELPAGPMDLSEETFKSEQCPMYPFPVLLPRIVQGYNFIEKTWVDLEVDAISDVKWNTKAFENLVTEDETKDLLEALVKNQLSVETSTDLIAGKGNGLIILLHGGPGTGKTYTAESVADYARKPLYRVTCGDIGTQPADVEKYLDTVLRLGRIWGCVVLLDEADIFLEERTLADLERNALVSVFLRVLEYYNGILILTSNRVGHFDEAFKSRIQLALHYGTLTQTQRHQIWTNFIKHLRAATECRMDFDDLVLHIGDLAKEEMNGRQIRNSITTARQLAEFRGRKLDYGIIRKVIKVAGRFDTYLQDVKMQKEVRNGTVDDAIARDSRMR